MLKVDPATAANHRRYPSISLLVPLAGATPWQARLGRLRRAAVGRLHDEFGVGVDAGLIERLADTVDTATPPPGARSLAVYVNSDRCSVVGLGVEVRERVIIDDTFATRDLLAADLRQPRYWVLALNLADPQLLDGHGGRLHPRPLQLTDSIPHPSSTRAGRGRDRSAFNDARRTRLLRAIDMAIGTALARNHDPLIVVGAEPTLSRFLDRTRHADRIEGVVRRAPDAQLAALADTVAPAVAEMVGERRLDALECLDRAISNGTAASGIEPVWHAARRQPGLLLVENSFEQPATITADGRLEPAADHAAPGVLDDAVDEIIERVLGAGGRVELLPDGLLERHRRIAFVPWRRRRAR